MELNTRQNKIITNKENDCEQQESENASTSLNLSKVKASLLHSDDSSSSDGLLDTAALIGACKQQNNESEAFFTESCVESATCEDGTEVSCQSPSQIHQELTENVKASSPTQQDNETNNDDNIVPRANTIESVAEKISNKDNSLEQTHAVSPGDQDVSRCTLEVQHGPALEASTLTCDDNDDEAELDFVAKKDDSTVVNSFHNDNNDDTVSNVRDCDTTDLQSVALSEENYSVPLQVEQNCHQDSNDKLIILPEKDTLTFDTKSSDSTYIENQTSNQTNTINGHVNLSNDHSQQLVMTENCIDSNPIGCLNDAETNENLQIRPEIKSSDTLQITVTDINVDLASEKKLEASLTENNDSAEKENEKMDIISNENSLAEPNFPEESQLKDSIVDVLTDNSSSNLNEQQISDTGLSDLALNAKKTLIEDSSEEETSENSRKTCNSSTKLQNVFKVSSVNNSDISMEATSQGKHIEVNQIEAESLSDTELSIPLLNIKKKTHLKKKMVPEPSKDDQFSGTLTGLIKNDENEVNIEKKDNQSVSVNNLIINPEEVLTHTESQNSKKRLNSSEDELDVPLLNVRNKKFNSEKKKCNLERMRHQESLSNQGSENNDEMCTPNNLPEIEVKDKLSPISKKPTISLVPLSKLMKPKAGTDASNKSHHSIFGGEKGFGYPGYNIMDTDSPQNLLTPIATTKPKLVTPVKNDSDRIKTGRKSYDSQNQEKKRGKCNIKSPGIKQILDSQSESDDKESQKHRYKRKRLKFVSNTKKGNKRSSPKKRKKYNCLSSSSEELQISDNSSNDGNTKKKYLSELSESENDQDNSEKQKELQCFKPKKATVNIQLLPRVINENIISDLGLKRIICDGTIVAQVESQREDTTQVVTHDNSRNDEHLSIKKHLLNSSDSSANETENNENSKKKIRMKMLMEKMKAKRALLNLSSSSDTDDEQLKKSRMKAKQSLLHETPVKLPSEKDQSSALNTMEIVVKSPSTKDIVDGNETQIANTQISHCINESPSKDKDTSGTNVASLERKEHKDDAPGNLANEIKSNHIERGDERESDTDQQKSSAADPGSGSVDVVKPIEKDNDSSCSDTERMGGSKTRASSSKADSENDDTEVNRLTNLRSLEKKSSSGSSGATASPRMKSKGKPSPGLLVTENLLDEMKSSSDEEQNESGEGEGEGGAGRVNGRGSAELARRDLLGDQSPHSDSSQNGQQSDVEEGSEKEQNMMTDDNSQTDDEVEKIKKTKRRKGKAIRSESEEEDGGEKDKESEFEVSGVESDGSEAPKKRKKIVESDDSFSKSSTDGGSKKKRRRIKQVKESESESGSDNEKRKHGRKNIRKVIGKSQLEEATKKAAREERERLARIAERQKLYNESVFDESTRDEVALDKVVLDFDPETREPLIQLDKGLVAKLKPHQANGIKFMWDACFESVKQIKKGEGSGCILAHCMGLGKTLQVVALTHALLTHSELTGVSRVLVVCPLSTVLNWVNEFRMWVEYAHSDHEIDIYELSRYKQNSERSQQLREWVEGGGVCVLGYEMFRNLSADNTKKFRKKMLATFQESLVDPGPDLVVCDEGHLLKNEKTSLSQSMNRIRTKRRIVLTGTPLQNNLKEYYCMVQFVKPNLLGKYNEYLNRFVNPITNGQYTDSTERDIRIMKRRSHVLHKMLDGAVQRRDYSVLAPFLPPKQEYVLFVTLTPIQIKLYQHYLDNYSRKPLPGRNSGFLFPDFQSLQRIWTHPYVLRANSDRYEVMQQKKRDREEDSEGSLVDFIDDESTAEESTTDESSDEQSDVSDNSLKGKKKKSDKKSKSKDDKAATARRSTRANPQEGELEKVPDLESIEKYENPTEWWTKLVEEDELEDMRHSNKLLLLFDILRQCEAIGDKLLVFSQSLYSLDLIEYFLGKVDEATQEGRIEEKLANHVGSWAPGLDYFRLDGSTSCENRSIWCKNFNREDNPRARLFLISTRAGGLGINLVAANRVVIFDVSWNPSHDVQSIFRVYRFGQKKPCYIYRFLVMGTMEEKIYERQVTKQAISKRVIDEQQIDRHYAENDLAELYTFTPEPPLPRPVPPLPRDRLFAEMLKEHELLIYKYHEHDSLLENKEEETLSEEERKAAWDDFENEKNRPPPAPLPNWPQQWTNGYANNLMAQQQMAAMALVAMLRKEYPGLSEQQLANMLPLILNSNPSLLSGYDFGMMQKMNEMAYKYPQPPMMNPMMMNAGGVPAGAGGAPGLQYEPPWQRHAMPPHHMQHMGRGGGGGGAGVKYYAGGLGSRDPVSMALQQQRQRDLLAPPPSAHPPQQHLPPPRAPRAPRAPRLPSVMPDVVDLDSD